MCFAFAYGYLSYKLDFVTSQLVFVGQNVIYASVMSRQRDLSHQGTYTENWHFIVLEDIFWLVEKALKLQIFGCS